MYVHPTALGHDPDLMLAVSVLSILAMTSKDLWILVTNKFINICSDIFCLQCRRPEFSGFQNYLGSHIHVDYLQ